jgi:hypothetical protein
MFDTTAGKRYLVLQNQQLFSKFHPAVFLWSDKTTEAFVDRS